ncbi:hypothetical protein BD779DRAFT_1563766 [Infundibulicybe gibba]|nr:hypothetical protein BD779DRAFT_1563766 [Infundibulicybe gibba]
MPKNASIGRIPPEILSEIFVHCLPVLPDLALGNIQQLLSSVCRLWHMVVLNTPALWASLEVTCRNDNDPYPPLLTIHAHLERSRTHPLSFIIRRDESEYIDEQAWPSFHAVLKTLVTARQRWRHVYIELDVMTEDILDFITLGDAPLLQNFHCDIAYFRQILPVPLRELVQGCPRLESFRWEGASPGSLLQPLGDTQLTSVSILARLSASECTALLQLSPRLSSAKLCVSNDGPSPASHLIHSTLCTLAAEGPYFGALLASLTLPALQDLDLNGHNVIFSTEWEITLLTFFARSRPTLHQLSLSMSHNQNYEPRLLRILTHTPHLRGLKLSDYCPEFLPFTSVIIRGLHPSSAPDAPLCPRLQSLDIRGVSYCPDGLCGAMLRARWGTQAHTNGVACLEKVYIQMKDGVHNQDQADMEELRVEGMQGVIFLYGHGGYRGVYNIIGIWTMLLNYTALLVAGELSVFHVHLYIVSKIFRGNSVRATVITANSLGRGMNNGVWL